MSDSGRKKAIFQDTSGTSGSSIPRRIPGRRRLYSQAVSDRKLLHLLWAASATLDLAQIIPTSTTAFINMTRLQMRGHKSPAVRSHSEVPPHSVLATKDK